MSFRRLLLSRKRKLSELYYATVSWGDLETTVHNPQYQEKERLFLDANDIQKGRFFDVSTLPPRPRHFRPPLSETILQTSQIPHNIQATHSYSSSSAPHPSSGAPSPKRVPSPAVPLAPPVHVQESKDVEADGEDAGTKEAPSDVTVSGRSSEVKSTPYELEQQNQKTIGPAGSSQQQGGQGLQHAEDTSETTTGPPEVEPGGELRPGPSFQQVIREETGRQPSPLVLAPISTNADPQSSPASTNGAGSSNAPDVAAGSPTTRPGDEHGPEELRNLDHDPLRGDALDASKSTDKKPSAHLDAELPHNAKPMQPPTDVSHDSIFRPRPNSVLGGQGTPGIAATATGKPSMRIDTQNVASSHNRPRDINQSNESPMSLNNAFTPRRVPSSASASGGQSPPGRITRISSGTIRHRSVSEILGERPKPPSPAADKPSNHNPGSASVREAFEASTLQSRLTDRKEREKDRSKLSTVVFAKQQHALESAPSTELLRKVSGEITPYAQEERDYLHTLFESKAYSPPRGQSLNTLLQSAHKTLSTADYLIDYQEQMNCRTLKRIYQLQSANRWPLRQMERAPEPVRPTSHWDFLLDHAKWMRTDFKEERKWKIAAARGVAEWCAEWVGSSPRRRQQLQIRVRPHHSLSNLEKDFNVQMEDHFEASASPVLQTPDLVPSAENDSISDGYVDDIMDLRLSSAPAAIFSLGASDFIFPMSQTPATDKLLSELPFYEPARIGLDLSQSDLAERSDAKWKTDIIPISRFATEKIRYRPPKAPSKRSRYDYEEEEYASRDSQPLPPEQTNVALFMPENKHIRDRIHPGHSFRPPSEYQMPAQAFFESRASSQWTQIEDDELRKLVKDYSYNWSLISSCLSTRLPFHSGADRRTPWECFERWINLEGLPADMSKTPYFRAYHSRIEAAGRHVIAQQEAAQRQIGGNPALTARKRTTQPIRVERKKNQRHLAMLDAMRKLAKKRETALQKQQHAADLAAMRKANEADRPRPPYSTPAEFSRLKHEREVKLAERQEIYRLQVLAQQKAAMQQRTAQMNQANGLPNGSARSSSGLANGGLAGPSNSGMSSGLPSAIGSSHQPRPQPGLQGLPNGGPSNGTFPANMLGPKGLTQGQMQAGLASGRSLGNSPEHMRVLYEATRLQQQQQMMLATRQHQQQGSNGSTGQRSSPNMSNAGIAGANGNPNSPAFLATMVASNGVPSPSMPGSHANGVGNAGSPRLANGHPLSSGVMPAISQLAAGIQRQNPEMAAEDVQRLATSQLNAYRQHAAQNASQKSMNQAALNAAAGAANASAHAANASTYSRQGMMTNEHVQAYNAQLRHQQAAQRANGGYGNASLSAGFGMNVNGNMGGLGGMAGFTGSPVLNMARPVSNHTAQGQLSRSATPRDQRGSSSGVMAQGSPARGPQGQMQS
ncbi:hypothetical protein EPUS_00195 [Endocarpon pusillum Z07020]|uniref:Vacuolar import and degradation protein 21 n=1 Tax=Endocarpon pusillum (strain Z07020 / HMAS-L-300199) TaxID=1263415 RepID=U1GCT5_ENDPU|nr:uncharacterized protein EPUS_00195 [Endocarpon pusillum Z07020]ERF75402.1 hypothetical protein EPUS_00195 [Endocarpon pusillum Z07020]